MWIFFPNSNGLKTICHLGFVYKHFAFCFTFNSIFYSTFWNGSEIFVLGALYTTFTCHLFWMERFLVHIVYCRIKIEACATKLILVDCSKSSNNLAKSRFWLVQNTPRDNSDFFKALQKLIVHSHPHKKHLWWKVLDYQMFLCSFYLYNCYNSANTTN